MTVLGGILLFLALGVVFLAYLGAEAVSRAVFTALVGSEDGLFVAEEEAILPEGGRPTLGPTALKALLSSEGVSKLSGIGAWVILSFLDRVDRARLGQRLLWRLIYLLALLFSSAGFLLDLPLLRPGGERYQRRLKRRLLCELARQHVSG